MNVKSIKIIKIILKMVCNIIFSVLDIIEEFIKRPQMI